MGRIFYAALSILCLLPAIASSAFAQQETWSLLPGDNKKVKSAFLSPYKGPARARTNNIIIVVDSAATGAGTRFLSDLALALQDDLYRKGFDCGLSAGRTALYTPDDPDDLVVALELLEPGHAILDLAGTEIPYCHRIGITQIRPGNKKNLDTVAYIVMDREAIGAQEFISSFSNNICRYTGH